MGIVLKYDLEYREKGEKKILSLSIDFVSNYCIREYAEISAAIATVKNSWQKISDLTTEITAAAIEQPEGYKQANAERKAQIEEYTKGILDYSDDKFLRRRFELIKLLLSDNGITDENFLSFDFWDRQVDPATANAFLDAAIYKDINKKKLQ